MVGSAVNSPLLELLVVRCLLYQVQNLLGCQLWLDEGDRGKLTWLVSWAFARGNALGLGADMMSIVFRYGFRCTVEDGCRGGGWC